MNKQKLKNAIANVHEPVVDGTVFQVQQTARPMLLSVQELAFVP